MTAPVIGILGGIGSGKSSVIRKIQDLKLLILDADVVGHEVLKSAAIIDQLVHAFGSEILDGKQVDRRKLGSLVFGNHPKQQQNLKTLNSIVHPEIRQRLHDQIAAGKQNSDAVILDASLLLEGSWDDHCDFLIFVDTDLDVRQERVQRTRGWDADELPKRERNQVSVATKRDRADFEVKNSGGLDDSVRQMRDILRQILTEWPNQK